MRRRILITQRRDMVPGRPETRDALDVRWASLLYGLNYLPIPVCSDLADNDGYLEALNPSAIVLTGGNDIGQAPKRDRLETQLLIYSDRCDLPVLGICRGMQMMNSFLGGGLIEVKGHVATYHRLRGQWADELGYAEVNSYHNMGISDSTLAPELFPLARTTDGVIEAVKHQNKPWMGVMWHPEREQELSASDKKMIKNILG